MAEKPSFAVSVATRLLEDRLAACQMGEFVSYEELNRVCNGNVQNGDGGCLQSARRRLKRDKRVVFGTVLGKGLKRLTDDEIVESGKQSLDAIRRRSRTAIQTQQAADFAKLSPEGRQTFCLHGSLLALVADATSRGTERKVLEAVKANENKTLDLKQCLKALGG